ncbi:MAG: MFS transporter [Candidatus Heimdallarchaeota archaeon]
MLDHGEDLPLLKSKTDGQRTKLYTISLGGSIAQNLIWVYVPYFAIALGAGYSEQGLITSVRTLGNSLTQSLWGTQSDKHGRRPVLIFGYVILALTALSFTFSAHLNLSMFVVLVAIQGFCGFAVVTGGVWNSTLGDIALERERGAVLGKIISFGVFGSVPVIMLFGYLLDRQGLTGPNQYHLAFLAASAVIVFTILLILILKETLQKRPLEALPPPWRIIRQHRRFRRFLTIDVTFIFFMAMMWPLFPFVIKEVVQATNTQLSMIWAAWMCFVAMAQKFGGALSDRMGRKPLIIFSRSLLFVVPFLFALSSRWPSWKLLLVAQCFGGIGWGLSLLLENMIALDLAPTEQKALFTGTTFTFTGIAGFMGALISGTTTQILTTNFGALSALVKMLYVAAVARLILGLAHVLVDETAPAKGSASLK